MKARRSVKLIGGVAEFFVSNTSNAYTFSLAIRTEHPILESNQLSSATANLFVFSQMHSNCGSCVTAVALVYLTISLSIWCNSITFCRGEYEGAGSFLADLHREHPRLTLKAYSGGFAY